MNLRRLAAIFLTLLLLSGCRERPRPVEPGPSPPPASPAQPTATYDLVIRDVSILDGTGSPSRVGDIAVSGDKIVAVGRLGTYKTEREISAHGLVAAPGFINPHSHTHDFPGIVNPFEDWDATASLMQGITTEIGGVDGRSPLPIGEALENVRVKGTGVNFGLFVGQGSVRGAVMGDARGVASPAQLDRMKEMVRQGMHEGAFGLSSGLEYSPGGFASAAEVAALVAETRPYGGIYSTHLRSEGDDIEAALAEALAIAKKADVPLNLSHFKIVKSANWGKLDRVIAAIEGAIHQGQKVFADVYPYLAPDYAVNRPLSEWVSSTPPEHLLITQAKDGTLVGRSLKEVAKERGISASDAARSLQAQDPGLTVVAQVNSEEAMIRFYQQPWSVVSTDGESQPKLDDPREALRLRLHRRSYGTYPQLLGYYVRDRQLVGLETMIRKMTGAVADSLGIVNRGYLKEGYFADIVLFDPATVADRTTWLKPQEYPAGIRWVMVNGQVAVEDGKRLPGRPGRIVKRDG